MWDNKHERVLIKLGAFANSAEEPLDALRPVAFSSPLCVHVIPNSVVKLKCVLYFLHAFFRLDVSFAHRELKFSHIQCLDESAKV